MRSGLHGKRSGLCAGLLVLGLSVLTLTVNGCGSGGGTTSTNTPISSGANSAAQGRTVGKARITLQWPAPAASTASDAASVQITVLQNNQPVTQAERLLTRPASGATGLTNAVTWDNLPEGDVVFVAVAYGRSDGAGGALAQAAVVSSVNANEEKVIALTLASPADHLEITTGALFPATDLAPATIFKGDTLPVAAAFVDKENRVVLSSGTLGLSSSDAVNAPLTKSGVPGGAVLVTGGDATVTTLTATDAVSGQFVTLPVPVTGFVAQRLPTMTGSVEINTAGWIVNSDGNGRSTVIKPPYQTGEPVAPPSGLSADTLAFPTALNNKNQIGGYVQGKDASGNPVEGAFLSDAGGAATLLPPITGTDGTNRFPYIVTLNDNGTILLRAAEAVADYGYPWLGYEIKTGKVLELPRSVLLNGAPNPVYYSTITPADQFIGLTVRVSDDIVRRAVIVDLNGAAVQIAPFTSDTSTEAISGNAQGQIVGASSVILSRFEGGSGSGVNAGSGGATPAPYRPDPSHPFVWTPSSGAVALPMLPGFTNGTAKGINNNGLIVGTAFSDTSGESTGILWKNNRPRDLGTLLTGASTGLVLRDVNRISDTNFITATAAGPGTQYVLVPVTRKP